MPWLSMWTKYCLTAISMAMIVDIGEIAPVDPVVGAYFQYMKIFIFLIKYLFIFVFKI